MKIQVLQNNSFEEQKIETTDFPGADTKKLKKLTPIRRQCSKDD